VINELNIWYFYLTNQPSLTSYNGICQFNSYFNALFSVLLEFHMLCGSYIVFRITFRKTDSQDTSEIYNQFFTNEEESQNKTQAIEDKLPNDSQSNTSNLNEITKMENSNDANDQIEVETSNLRGKKETSPNKLKKAKFFAIIRSTRFKTLKNLSLPRFKGLSVLSSFKNDYGLTINSKKFKLEEVYFNLILKEKFLITLFSIVWIYLLSFLIWIYGVQRLKRNISYTSSNWPAIFSPGLKLNKTGVLNSYEEISVIQGFKFCSIYTFAKNFFKIYTVFVAFLRLFTLCINILVSVMHHIKFRKYYLNSIKNIFQRKISSDYSHQESFFKKFYFRKLNPLFTSKNTKKSAFFNKNMQNSIKSSNDDFKSIQSHFEHLHFLRFFAKCIFFYSLLIAPSVFNEFAISFEDVYEHMRHTRQINDNQISQSFYFSSANFTLNADFFDLYKININDTNIFDSTSNTVLKVLKEFNDDQYMNDSNLKSTIRFSEILAHSMKFIFYIFYKFRLEIFYKNKINGEKIRV
jgi:hypothetical protein